jgi:phospholipase C
MTDQSSILRFIEDNWLGGQRLGQGSFDSIANPINNMFDFTNQESSGTYLLDQFTGLVVSDSSM